MSSEKAVITQANDIIQNLQSLKVQYQGSNSNKEKSNLHRTIMSVSNIIHQYSFLENSSESEPVKTEKPKSPRLTLSALKYSPRSNTAFNLNSHSNTLNQNNQGNLNDRRSSFSNDLTILENSGVLRQSKTIIDLRNLDDDASMSGGGSGNGGGGRSKKDRASDKLEEEESERGRDREVKEVHRKRSKSMDAKRGATITRAHTTNVSGTPSTQTTGGAGSNAPDMSTQQKAAAFKEKMVLQYSSAALVGVTPRGKRRQVSDMARSAGQDISCIRVGPTSKPLAECEVGFVDESGPLASIPSAISAPQTSITGRAYRASRSATSASMNPPLNPTQPSSTISPSSTAPIPPPPPPSSSSSSSSSSTSGLLSPHAQAHTHALNTNLLSIMYAERDFHYYKEFFSKKEHYLYVGLDEPGHHVVIAVMKSEIDTNIRGIVWSQQGEERIQVPISSIKSGVPFGVGGIGSSDRLTAIKKHSKAQISSSTFHRIKSSSAVDDMVSYEASQRFLNYKFGILYAVNGQTDENLMFSNDSPSKDFEEFLEFLATKIELCGWNKFKGGLDVKSNTTGKYSYFTEHLTYQIMFHVSTLLPFYPDDPQKLERKRHLGNDIVVIIYMDGDTPFKTDTIKSEYNHVYIVVQKDQETSRRMNHTHYRISIVRKRGVPSFPPLLHYSELSFKKEPAFRELLLTKLINGERASYDAPAFLSKIKRTRIKILEDLASSWETSTN